MKATWLTIIFVTVAVPSAALATGLYAGMTGGVLFFTDDKTDSAPRIGMVVGLDVLSRSWGHIGVESHGAVGLSSSDYIVRGVTHSYTADEVGVGFVYRSPGTFYVKGTAGGILVRWTIDCPVRRVDPDTDMGAFYGVGGGFEVSSLRVESDVNLIAEWFEDSYVATASLRLLIRF